MNALVTPVALLANALPGVVTAAQTAAHRFLTSDFVPTWTEYLRDCNK
ncbi:hypothetical protein [Aliiroseovarius sediminis]|nr:hypothetical protein [Aliiroseovarius sediminis]MCI2394436.1 hypothetical protein [Aliiroseovarius sediminis]